MGKVHDGITGAIAEWISRQHMFVVATAASSTDGTVNVSPKGLAGTFAVLDERRCAYLDLTGSGVETIAHLRENGRVTLMWCAVEGPARIVRIHGTGEVVLPDDPGFAELSGRFVEHRGARAVIVVTAQRVSDSCGYSVPLMEYRGDRTRLDEWTASRSDEELATYRASRNALSIDGLPGL